MNDTQANFDSRSQHSHITAEQAEEELRESQRKWKTLIHNLPGAVYRFKPIPDSYKIQLEFISEGAQQITGRSLEDLIQQMRLSAK